MEDYVPRMDCVVVGGAANGMILKQIDARATVIGLRRPGHIKPLTNSRQNHAEVAHEEEAYHVHPISIRNVGDTKPTLFGVAVPEGTPLTKGFTALIVGYVENETRKLTAPKLETGRK